MFIIREYFYSLFFKFHTILYIRMDASISYLLAGVIVFSFAAILVSIGSKKGGRKKQKSRATIIRDATRKLSQDPHNPDGLIPLAELYFSEHSFDKAYGLYDTMLNIAPAHSEINPFQAALRQGICGLKIGKAQDAMRGLQAAYNIKPSDFEANYYLGQAFYKNDAFEKAIPCLKKAVVIKPDASSINTPLGLSLYKAKHFKESLPYLKRSLDDNPDNKEALFSMADAMQECGMGEKAIKVFLHLRPDPNFGAKSCLSAGIYHSRANQVEKAIQDFEIGLKHQNIPQDIYLELKYRIANCYLSLKNIGLGLQHLQDISVINNQYKDVPQLISRYQELNQNKNLQTYLMSGSSDFVALCRNIVMNYYKGSVTKIQDINVQPDNVEILVNVETAKWEDTEVFRFYRSQGATGELMVRDFHGRVSDSKADRGICFTAGVYSDEARRYSEGRPIDLVEKDGLIKLLKRIDNI